MAAKKLTSPTRTVFVRHSLGIRGQFQALRSLSGSIEMPYLFYTYSILFTFRAYSIHTPQISNTSSIHIPCIFHAHSMHIPNIFHTHSIQITYSIHIPYTFHTYSIHIPYIFHNTYSIHIAYICIPYVFHTHSIQHHVNHLVSMRLDTRSRPPWTFIFVPRKFPRKYFSGAP